MSLGPFLAMCLAPQDVSVMQLATCCLLDALRAAHTPAVALYAFHLGWKHVR